MKRLPEEDLKHIYNHTAELWEELRNKSIFITGGTGFFGKWLLESFLYCNKALKLNARAIILSRSPEKFLEDFPDYRKEESLFFVKGDIESYSFQTRLYEFIIHAAVEYKESLELFDSIINGTKRILDFTVRTGAKKVLFISSGAVYGKQPSSISHLPEDYPGSPDPMLSGSAYGLAKRVAEFYGAESARRNQFDFLIARCFAFAGPYLPLDKGAAIGNFIRDAISGNDITIGGDGTPYRSYLYASDLMIWLWTILFKGFSGRPYNVGSEDEVSIQDLANEVKKLVNPAVGIFVRGQKKGDTLPERYVPSTKRIRTELDLKVNIQRVESIIKMANWIRK